MLLGVPGAKGERARKREKFTGSAEINVKRKIRPGTEKVLVVKCEKIILKFIAYKTKTIMKLF